MQAQDTPTTAAPEYPEHEKLAKVKDRSQAIGEFLDYTLPRLGNGMALYEKVVRDCECEPCDRGLASRWHTDEELATTVVDEDGRIAHPVQITEWWPTNRTIQSMLAEAFGVDEEKLAAEKEAMLDAMRAASGASGRFPR